jgi:putative membrane protein
VIIAVTTLAADTDHHWQHGWWPFPWLLIVLVIALLVWRRGCFGQRGGGARSILAERFARGEISAEEYRERLGQLGRGR